MKKNTLFVCLFATGSKEHNISRSLLLVMNGWNLVGPWVIEFGKSESGYKFGVKGQKNTDFSRQLFEDI
jgi:hypothetical protein